jgi:hypothetical protein
MTSETQFRCRLKISQPEIRSSQSDNKETTIFNSTMITSKSSSCPDRESLHACCEAKLQNRVVRSVEVANCCLTCPTRRRQSLMPTRAPISKTEGKRQNSQRPSKVQLSVSRHTPSLLQSLQRLVFRIHGNLALLHGSPKPRLLLWGSRRVCAMFLRGETGGVHSICTPQKIV